MDKIPTVWETFTLENAQTREFHFAAAAHCSSAADDVKAYM